MVKQIVIVGAGFGGLEAATRLRQELDDSNIEMGEQQVSGLDTNFLGYAEPRVNLLGPSADMRTEKEIFEKNRITT